MLFPCRFFVFGVSDVFEISQGCVKHHDSMSWCTNTKTKGVERERHDFITKINGFDTVYHMCVYIYLHTYVHEIQYTYMHRCSAHLCISNQKLKDTRNPLPRTSKTDKIGSLKSHCRNHNQGEPEKNRLLYSTKRVCSSRTSSFRPWKQHVKQWEGQNIRRLQKTYKTMFKRPMTYKWEISIKQIWGAWHWVDSCCKTLQYSLRQGAHRYETETSHLWMLLFSCMQELTLYRCMPFQTELLINHPSNALQRDEVASNVQYVHSILCWQLLDYFVR